MPCALTSGYTIDCRESIGGIKRLLIANFSSVSQTMTISSEVITAITMISSAKFYEFQQVKETSNFTEAIRVSDVNGTVGYETTLTAIFNKGDTALRNQVRLLAQSPLMIIIQDRNGKYWLMGKECAAEMTTGNHTSGTVMADRNGYELTFVAKENLPMYEVSSSIIAGLL